tara:strand:+ start:467 stop:931 length:465 start_codon:yes stop_codon:yes gene_type:complete
MKKTIHLGGEQKKGSSIIEIELKETHKGWCFSASGLHDYQYCRSTKMWDYQCAGQCLETIAKKWWQSKKVITIVELWRKYHLNDMNAGSPKQTAHLASLGEYQSYDWACEELKKVDLLYDKEFSPDQPYRYGSAWLYREIPKKDLETIKSIINK